MIEQNEIFEEVKDNIGLWCEEGCSGADLASAAGVAITNKLHTVCVAPTAIAPLWAWLENTNVHIFGRFMIDKHIDENIMSEFSSQVNMAFRNGADGALVCVHMRELEHFVSELMYIRDDLFFNKTLDIELDINEIDLADWEKIFRILQSVRADALTLFLSHDDGDKSDFVGRIYAMLNTNMADWHGALHFHLGQNIARIDQVYRLTSQIRPVCAPSILFWINRE